MENIIEITNLCYAYEEKNVVDNLTVNFPRGKWIAVLGHNGSGKSTLSKLIIGLLRPKSGEVKVANIPLTDETVYDIREKVGLVFQNPDNQFVGSTVREDIAFGMENRCITRNEMIKRIDEYANKVNMSEYLNSEPHNLSGGQKQRVAIAGSLALEAEILIFDEATSMLDPQGRSEVIDIISNLKEENKTIISITHDMNEAMLADEIVVMNEGKIILKGKPDEIFKNIETLKECGLDVPLSVKVSKHFHDIGLFDEIIIDEEELVNKIWQLSSIK